MSYQEITGTLNANQHGSYTTQDAFGDLLVTDVLYRQRTNKSKYIGQSGCVELYARSTSDSVRERERERESMDSNKDYVVRRLTPTECERLQGFPTGWTDIPGASDTARYKALGNSIALPQWQIIIDNMAKYLPEKATLGSLFDGIGGFPLCWERTHGKGTAIWASEIEAFPIAVTTYRFGEDSTT